MDQVKKRSQLLHIRIYTLIFATRKRKFSFLNISHKVQKVSKCLEHQQGVTKNKLYNAKG